MLFVSLPIYVCATASIPIAVALLGKGVSAGAVFVFLMAGPATNASSIAVVKKILGKKTMYLYLFLIAFTSIFFGIILDYFHVIKIPMNMTHAHIHDEMNFISIFLTIVFILILLNAYLHKSGNIYEPSKKEDSKTNNYKEKLSFIVGGITCSHCKESIRNVLDSFNEIKSATINQQTGQVSILGEKLNKDTIKSKIKNLGFTVN
jgi:copper chaperone CopZ